MVVVILSRQVGVGQVNRHIVGYGMDSPVATAVRNIYGMRGILTRGNVVQNSDASARRAPWLLPMEQPNLETVRETKPE